MASWKKENFLGISRWSDSLKATKAEDLAAHFGENVTKFQGKASSAICSSRFEYPRRTSYPARRVVSTIMSTQFHLAHLKAKKEKSHHRRLCRVYIESTSFLCQLAPNKPCYSFVMLSHV
ncbi:hypothetical protein PAHAL_9G437700 [Panicum hallii]|jgi:hypothetical protein|uniref:Uncharacterized protein n=1 Tax=Panicum hallii TaxID=206008 RepID=A0A2T8I4K4_9POAL|nr:hypothetical protein PAHAL_9G437700 [Panicum hallii]